METQYSTAGHVLAQAERSVGTVVHAAVDSYYKGADRETAQAIRLAASEEEAARMVTAMRRGRAAEVLMVAGSAVAGVAAGALSQRVVGNFTVKRVPPVSALGLVPAGVGLWAPVGLAGRSMMAAGGMAFLSGSVLYSILVPQEAQP